MVAMYVLWQQTIISLSLKGPKKMVKIQNILGEFLV